MYNVSEDFISAIKDKVREIHWSGSINTATPITLDDDSFFKCSITRKISDNKLSIGTVYTAQITAELHLPNVSRYELYGKTITIFVSVDGANDVIPMGIYIITEATQTSDHINIKAYDNMIKFDNVTFNPEAITNTMLPYMVLSDICTKCGVELGNIYDDIYAMPNGNRTTGFADVVTDVKTYRDFLKYLVAYLGGYSYIGRDGKLYIGHYGSNSVDTIPSDFRCSSSLSDYRTTYSGLYATYKDDAIQEYKTNNNSDGLILDLETNPFLQISNDENRNDALQSIIDVWEDIYYVPYSATMPLMPHYDVGDVITFTEKQAGEYDYGAVTEITYNLNGVMSVKCSGENPRLATALDRFSKSVEGLNNDYGLKTGDKDFWLIFIGNDAPIEVSDEEVEIAELEYEQKTYVQNVEMVLSLSAILSDTADVNIRIIVDDDEDMEFTLIESHSTKGTRMFHGSNPRKIYGQGVHTAKVYMTVTDSPTLWSDFV